VEDMGVVDDGESKLGGGNRKNPQLALIFHGEGAA